MLEITLAALAGLLIGSFLNVCIYRLPRDLSVVSPRSFCPNCEAPVAWYDNIPLVSYLLLRGRCRECRNGIPLRYLLVELFTGVAFAVSVARLGVSWEAGRFAMFAAIMIALIATDLEERILPDEMTIGGAIAGLIFAWLVPPTVPGLIQAVFLSLDPRWGSVADAMFAAALASGAIWLVGEVYYRLRHREGLGFGDVKMVAMIGAFLGLQGALLTLILGSLFGAVGGLLYIFLTGKDASTYELPFGSFLGGAAIMVAVFGEFVLGWYSRMGA